MGEREDEIRARLDRINEDDRATLEFSDLDDLVEDAAYLLDRVATLSREYDGLSEHLDARLEDLRVERERVRTYAERGVRAEVRVATLEAERAATVAELRRRSEEAETLARELETPLGISLAHGAVSGTYSLAADLVERGGR